jgi:hypothetical protein
LYENLDVRPITIDGKQPAFPGADVEII